MLRWMVATDGSSLSLNSSLGAVPCLERKALPLPIRTFAGELTHELHDARP